MSQQQYTSAQIIEQNKNFYDAYKSGKITYEQYVDVARFQKQALAEAQAREGKPVTQTPAPKVVFRTSFLPPEPGTPSYALQGSYAQQGSTVYTSSGEKVGVVGSPNMPALTPGESYQVEPPQPPVKQQDLGVAAQMDVAFQLGIKTAEGLISQQSNPVLREIAKAELNYAVAPILGGVAGGAATIESNVYSAASLAKSAVVSVQTGELQYSPVKTPILAPTVLGGAVGLITGNAQEAQQINAMPGLYGVGYGYGSAFTEVGLATIEGVGIGFVAGKASNVLRTVVNPRVNQFAESILARSKLVAQTGLNRVSPGLGVKAEIVYNRDVARVASKLNSVDASLTGRANAARLNVKYGLVEPVKLKAGLAVENVGVKAGKVTSRIMPESLKEAKMFSKSVVSPNLADYAKVSTPKSIGKIPKLVKQSELYQGSKFTVNRVANRIKLPTDLRVLSNQALKNKYIIGKVPKVESTVKPVKVIGKADVFKGKVVSRKNISTSEALGIASKRKGSLRGTAYEDTFKVNEPKMATRSSQVVRQVEKQTLGVTSKQATKVNPFAIVVSGANVFAGSYPGTQRRQRFVEEMEVVSLPRSMADLGVKQESRMRLLPSAPSFLSGVSGLSKNGLVNVPSKIDTGVAGISDVKFDTNIAPVLRFNIVQEARQGQKVSQALRVSSKQIDVFKMKAVPLYSRGGGSGGGSGGGALRGRWNKQNNPIKSYDQMLKDISGLGIVKHRKNVRHKR